MKTEKDLSLTGVPWLEGQACNGISFQPAFATKEAIFTIAGPITISSITGTILSVLAAAADGTTFVPYLLMMAGSLTWTGTCKQGKGLKVNNIPIWLLWLENYIENKGNGPVVDDGGMAAANFAAGTYNISINFHFKFYDHRLPVSQRGMMYYRPSRYDKQPTWNITGGTLFKTPYLANSDLVALTGDTTTSCALVYTTNLKIYATAVMVPSFKYMAGDVCFDKNYEYTPQLPCTSSQSNNQTLADLGVQMYIYMLASNLAAAGSGTNLREAGIDLFGSANQGLIDTDMGNAQLNRPNAVNLKAKNVAEFLTSLSAWPAGMLIIDEYGGNLNEWAQKTFLQLDASAHIVNEWITAAAAIAGSGLSSGTNERLFHITGQPSQSAINSVGQNRFPAFQGQ